MTALDLRIRPVVLITGGQGYIGTFLSRELLKEQFIVRTVNRSADLSIARECLKPLRGSILDTDFLRNAMSGVETVFHLAGVGSPGSQSSDDSNMIETNVSGTLSVLRAAADSGVRRVIVASSAAVYGNVKEDPKREAMPVQPDNMYAVSKTAAEHTTNVFHQRYGIETVVARLFNVYGPRQERPGQSRMLIPSVVRCLRKHEAIEIRGEGTQTRDFIYVEDVARALLHCCLEPNLAGETINVGTGRATSIVDMVTLAGKTSWNTSNVYTAS